MGMYTELALAVKFKLDAPEWFVETLTKMANGWPEGETPAAHSDCPPHPLFETERWWWMLRSGGSSYFNMHPMVLLERDPINFNPLSLTVWTNIKNYGDEWGHFIDWIAPFIGNNREHIGHRRYEESDHPTLLYALSGRIVGVRVEDAKAIDLYDESTWPQPVA